LCDASAMEKIGASVESDPSTRPTIAGCTRCSKKTCSSDTDRVYQSIRNKAEHKADLTNTVRAA
jgi:hypothetical protein